MGSCSRSAKWAWDRPGGGCNKPLSGTGGLRSEWALVRTRPVCKYRLWQWKMGLWQPPSGQPFAERELWQKPIPGISISKILGVGSHTKIPGVWDYTCDVYMCTYMYTFMYIYTYIYTYIYIIYVYVLFLAALLLARLIAALPNGCTHTAAWNFNFEQILLDSAILAWDSRDRFVSSLKRASLIRFWHKSFKPVYCFCPNT